MGGGGALLPRDISPGVCGVRVSGAVDYVDCVVVWRTWSSGRWYHADQELLVKMSAAIRTGKNGSSVNVTFASTAIRRYLFLLIDSKCESIIFHSSLLTTCNEKPSLSLRAAASEVNVAVTTFD